MSSVVFNRVWSMPSKNTFELKPVKELIEKYIYGMSVDPFANKSKIATITNDLNPEYNTDFCMDALDFLKTLKDDSVDFMFYDPPFSPRQVSECYKSLGKTVNKETTQSSFWGNLKKEISRVVKSNGYVISCGWNSGGVGKTNKF